MFRILVVGPVLATALVLPDPRPDVASRNLVSEQSGLESLSLKAWTSSIFEDIFSNLDEWEPSTRPRMLFSGSDPMTGFDRAAVFNNCSTKYHAPGWPPFSLISDDLHAVYMLHGKSASSTIRKSFKPFEIWKPPKNGEADRALGHTRFTFVRDPLARAISGFFEAGYKCTKTAKLHPSRVLEQFEEMLSLVEGGSCSNPHLMGQRSRLDDPKRKRMDFIGTVDSLAQDWSALGESQTKQFNVAWPIMSPPQRTSGSKRQHMLNLSSIPDSVAQRVCDLYKDDYCCFQLPVPSACKIDC